MSGSTTGSSRVPKQLWRGILLGCCLVLGISQVAAQTTAVTTASRDTAAVASLDTAFNLMAPLTTRQGLHSVMVTGTVSLPGSPTTPVGTFTAKFVGSHFLINTTVGSHHTLYSSLGRHGQVNADGKGSPLTTSGVSDIGSDIFPPLEPWSNYASSSFGIRKAVDTQSIEGTVCREVDIQRPMGFTLAGSPTDDVRIFIDGNTGLLRAVDYAMNQTRIYNPHLRMRVIYGDYQSIGGITVPATIKRIMNGKPITVLHITKVDTQQVFDDSSLAF